MADPAILDDDAPWTTAALTADLAAYMATERYLSVREVMLPNGQRADLLCMERTMADRPLLILEVKVSRADLMGDLRRGKWRGYLACGAVAFAIPHGIAADEEIPPEAGLFVRSDHGWTKRRQIRWCEAPTPTPYLWRRLVLTVSEGDGPRKYGAVR